MAQGISTFRELHVYQKSMDAAMEIFRVTKGFPVEERYSLVDQIRRGSRSVCANIAEAWRKRRYKAAFVAKLTDAESETSETQVWLEFALRCSYLDHSMVAQLDDAYEQIMAGFVRMITEAEKWLIKVK